MNIGKLDRRVTVQERVTTKDQMNHDLITWTNRGTFWAGVKYSGGKDTQEGKQRVEVDRATFTFRYNSAFSTTDRIIFDGGVYDVHSIDELGRREGLRLTCTRRDNAEQ